MTERILFLVNDPGFFVSHRIAIAQAARAKGYEVHIASQPGRAVDRIRAEGFVHHTVPLYRSGKNIFQEAFLFAKILKIILSIKPVLVHLITIKPVIYGGIAARIANCKAVVAAVSGLGSVFISEGMWAALQRSIIVFLYRQALSHHNIITIFQNEDDREHFLSKKIVNRRDTTLLRGSGVDLSIYSYVQEPSDPVVVSMASRLLHDKGVMEYAEAVRLLKPEYPNVIFRLIGDMDSGNASSLTSEELSVLKESTTLDVLGHRDDIAELLSQSHIIVLPSYREGLPRVLCEAAACGRPVVTTDVPGCRDAIIAGKTGLLVLPQNAEMLSQAVEVLINSPDTRERMGRAARDFAEENFSIHSIVDGHMNVYSTLLKRAKT